MKPAKPVMALLVLLTLAGCASSQTKKRRIPVTPQPMVCEDGSPAQITLFTPDEARLVFAGKAHALKRQKSTDGGIQYGNKQIIFWNKGIDAAITPSGAAPAHCTYVPRSGL
ncbi:MAG: MliC family protein [Micavibrio sp.]